MSVSGLERQLVFCNVYPGASTITEQSTAMEIYSRGKWLLGLLIVQSTSGVVLENFEKLIEKHLVITFFLTMLVGGLFS